MVRMKAVALVGVLGLLGGGAGMVRGQVLGGGATATNLSVSTLTTGTVFSASAAMSGDGRYVTMQTHPQFSALDGIDTFSSGGLFGGTSQASGIRAMAFRPAVVGKVTFIEKDKELLGKTVPAVKLNGVGLREAVKRVAGAAKINISVGWRGLEQANVDTQAGLTLEMPEQSVKAAVVQLMGAGAPGEALVVTAEDNVVSVVTQGQGDKNMVSKLYRLADLLANIPRYASVEDLAAMGESPAEKVLGYGKPDATLVAAGLVGGPATRKGAAVMVDGKDVPLKELRGQQGKVTVHSTDIVELITSTVRPEVWKVHGGKAEISTSGDMVWIKAPASVHALLDGPVHKEAGGPMFVGYGGGGAVAR